MDLGLFFIAAVGSIEVLGVIMAGWSSNNKWSLLGTIRTATQMVSYEIPIGIAFVSVIVSLRNASLSSTSSTFRAASTVTADGDGRPVQLWFWHWTDLSKPLSSPLLVL